MNRSRTLLMQALSNELTSEERREFEALMEQDPGLREEYDRMVRLETFVSGTAHDSFSVGFADRVMESLSAGTVTSKESFFDMLASGFYRLAGVAVAIIAILCTYNISQSDTTDRSAIEAALGLQPVSIEAAYTQALQQQELFVVQEGNE